MFIDIRGLARQHSEEVKIKPLVKIEPDEFGIQDNSSFPEIKVNCIVAEKIDQVLNVSTGSYLPRVTFELYIPYNISVNNNLDGATVVRDNGQILIITSQSVKRRYASHAVFIATERKVYNDRA